MFTFGAGNMWGVPLQDATGAAITNPTPVLIGTLQEVSLDVAFETKTLHGQLQFPVAVGRSKGKLSGKAKFATLNGLIWNAVFFGQTLAANGFNMKYDTTGAAIPTTPFQITPTVPDSGTWVRDLGVRDASTGKPYTRVASAPATGQYTVAAGVYTFAAADTTKTVLIDYVYSFTSAAMNQMDVLNLPMGYAPTFAVELQVNFNGKKLAMRVPNCIGSKLTFATKLDDFVIPDFDFEAFADASGKVFSYSIQND